MLKDSMIYWIDQSNWVSPMVVQTRKHDPKNLRVCVYFRWINKVTPTEPYPTPFAGKIINEVVGHECYSFMDDFLGSNQLPIAKEDHNKATFICEFGSFSYKVIPFSLKNAAIVFSKTVIKAFQEYIYKIMVLLFWWFDCL